MVVHCAALTYLGTLNSWVALILRHDSRSRPMSRAWLIGLALGAGGIVGFALPWLNMTGWYDWSWLAACFAATIYSLSTARSWRAKLAPYRV